MLVQNILILVVTLAVIAFSIPKLASKYQTISPKTKEQIGIYIPVVLALIGAILLIGVIR